MTATALASVRSEAGARFFGAEAQRIARLCARMAERFQAGGRLLAVGDSAAARSDVRHIAVEFVHPVIVGKRALPALGVDGEEQLALLARDEDVVVRFAGGGVTIDGERFDPGAQDPFVRQEIVESLYHVLWELVHVFLEHDRRASHDAGAASFLYGAADPDPEALVADVAASVLMKSEEVGALREQTLGENDGVLCAAAAELRARLDAGGTLLALGNGGSATDAMDVVADFREPPHGWPPRRAIDLAEDPAILTAIANDVGVEAIFLRQVIAHGRPGDALLALSTSGSSGNVIAALAEARRRGLMTIAMVGYDGGRIAGEELADHVVVTRSQHIPRIQEAQASAYHVLRELVEA